MWSEAVLQTAIKNDLTNGRDALNCQPPPNPYYPGNKDCNWFLKFLYNARTLKTCSCHESFAKCRDDYHFDIMKEFFINCVQNGIFPMGNR